jgi:hypothetical protein
MQIDFTELPEVEDLCSVPAGEYTCTLAEVRESTSPAGHTRWGLRWEVDSGEWRGRTACWDSLHFSERGLARARFVFRVLGFAADGAVEIESGQLLGKRAVVTVTPEEREDSVSGVKRRQNRVPFTGYAPAPPQRGQG